MKSVSPVQKIVTWLVVIVLILIGLTALLKKEKVIVTPRIVPTVISAPTVYPCLAGDKCN